MPQLDVFSWLNQVFTTTIVMLVFYMVLTLIFLPTTSSILKGRTKLQALRALTHNVLNKQVTIHVVDTCLRLATILTNDLVYIWAFFSPSITKQFKMDIDVACYEAALEHIEELALNNSLIGTLPVLVVDLHTSQNLSSTTLGVEEGSFFYPRVVSFNSSHSNVAKRYYPGGLKNTEEFSLSEINEIIFPMALSHFSMYTGEDLTNEDLLDEIVNGYCEIIGASPVKRFFMLRAFKAYAKEFSTIDNLLRTPVIDCSKSHSTYNLEDQEHMEAWLIARSYFYKHTYLHGVEGGKLEFFKEEVLKSGCDELKQLRLLARFEFLLETFEADKKAGKI